MNTEPDNSLAELDEILKRLQRPLPPEIKTKAVADAMVEHDRLLNDQAKQALIAWSDRRNEQALVKRLEDIKRVVDIQGDSGNWNYDSYMHGMFNGMELILSMLENREPKYRDAPEKWLVDIEEQTKSNAEKESK